MHYWKKAPLSAKSARSRTSRMLSRDKFPRAAVFQQSQKECAPGEASMTIGRVKVRSHLPRGSGRVGLRPDDARNATLRVLRIHASPERRVEGPVAEWGTRERTSCGGERTMLIWMECDAIIVVYIPITRCPVQRTKVSVRTEQKLLTFQQFYHLSRNASPSNSIFNFSWMHYLIFWKFLQFCDNLFG